MAPALPSAAGPKSGCRAGSLAIVLLWAYYSSLILFFGAELTQSYARMRGSRIEPSENAEPATG